MTHQVVREDAVEEQKRIEASMRRSMQLNKVTNPGEMNNWCEVQTMRLGLTLPTRSLQLVTVVCAILLAGCSRPQNITCVGGEALAVASMRKGLFLSAPGHAEVVCADGSGPLRFSLPSNLEEAMQLAISPDGKRIAVHLLEGPHDHLYIADTPDVSLRHVLDLGTVSSSSSWSPDDRQLVMAAYFNAGYGIYILDLACLNRGEDCASKPAYLTSGSSPEWSPDGKRIVFVDSERKAEKGLPVYDIYVANIDGSDRVRLTNNYQNVDPVWSPDGEFIAYQSWGQDHPNGVYLMKADGTGTMFLTEGEQPQWSPDGQQLAFISIRDSSKEPFWAEGPIPNTLYLIDTSTKRATRVTQESDESIRSFAWLPLNSR